MKLYDYQEETLASISGSKILAWDLGTGKTLSSLAYWQRHGTGRPLLIIAPAAKIRTEDWREEAGRWFEDMPDITYISYERLRIMDKDTKRPRWWQYTGARNGGVVYDVIADECLTGETLITTNKGLKEIADIKVGDKVLSYNHKTKKSEYKPVNRLVQRYSDDDFYLVSYTNGAIISTYNHPHYVNGEYKLAKDIKPGDYLLYEQPKTYDTRSRTKKSNNKNANTNSEVRQRQDLRLLQDGCVGKKHGREASTAAGRQERQKLVLFKRVWQNLWFRTGKTIRQKTSSDNQQPRVASQGTRDAQAKRHRQAYLDSRPVTPTLDGWQRETNRTTKNVTTPIRAGACRVDDGATSSPTTGNGVPDSLQARYRQRLIAYWHRVRRAESQQSWGKETRPEERFKIRKVRVESVKILKQADIERLGIVRNPDYVYCLEVEDNNNFFANGILTHNCHSLKNPQSKQSKAVLEIVRSGGLFIGLSGTPMPNGWIDFAGYSKLFGYTKGITEFKNKYCKIVDYKGFPEIVGYHNTDELQTQLQAITSRLDAKNAAKLPDKRLLPVNIKLPPKDMKRYLDLKITRMDAKTGEILDNSTRLLSVLRQSTTNGRLDHLLSVVNDTSDNVIVFYNYVSERNAILKALAKTDKRILRYDGEKHNRLPGPNSELKNIVLVAHYKSASTGLNLQWANVTIYFSPTYSYQDFEQSIGRTHRNGQTKKCLYYLFNVKNTVDRDVWDCLRDKRSFQDKLWINQQ